VGRWRTTARRSGHRQRAKFPGQRARWSRNCWRTSAGQVIVECITLSRLPMSTSTPSARFPWSIGALRLLAFENHPVAHCDLVAAAGTGFADRLGATDRPRRRTSGATGLRLRRESHAGSSCVAQTQYGLVLYLLFREPEDLATAGDLGNRSVLHTGDDWNNRNLPVLASTRFAANTPPSGDKSSVGLASPQDNQVFATALDQQPGEASGHGCSRGIVATAARRFPGSGQRTAGAEVGPPAE